MSKKFVTIQLESESTRWMKKKIVYKSKNDDIFSPSIQMYPASAFKCALLISFINLNKNQKFKHYIKLIQCYLIFFTGVSNFREIVMIDIDNRKKHSIIIKNSCKNC